MTAEATGAGTAIRADSAVETAVATILEAKEAEETKEDEEDDWILAPVNMEAETGSFDDFKGLD